MVLSCFFCFLVLSGFEISSNFLSDGNFKRDVGRMEIASSFAWSILDYFAIFSSTLYCSKFFFVNYFSKIIFWELFFLVFLRCILIKHIFFCDKYRDSFVCFLNCNFRLLVHFTGFGKVSAQFAHFIGSANMIFEVLKTRSIWKRLKRRILRCEKRRREKEMSKFEYVLFLRCHFVKW